MDMDIDDKLNAPLDSVIESGERGGRARGRGRGRGRGEKRDRNENGGVIRVAKRIYVSNLTWRTSWQDLKDHFRQVGNVVHVDVLREGGKEGRSKGCAVVEFESAEQAAEAINTLHLSEVDGREIYVREDREDFDLKAAEGNTGKRGRPEGGAGGGAGGGSSSGSGKRVFVNNLAEETTWQALKDYFKQAGPVAHADVLAHEDGTSKRCGIVEFSAVADARRAISMLSNTPLDGRSIYVREDREDGAGRGRSPRVPGEANGSFRERAARAPNGAGVAEGTKIVVHGLPWSTEWQELKDLAKEHGDVIKADVMRRPDGKSRGFGTVVFKTPEDAQSGIEGLNGMDYEGRKLSAKLDQYN